MKNKVKVTEYWRKGSRYVHPNLTKWQLFRNRVKVFFKVLFWGIILISVLVGIFEAGKYTSPKTNLTNTVITIKEEDSFPPILRKIAKAESYDSQFCTEEIVKKKGCHSYEVGSVLIHVNDNKTYDIGRYAINSIHLLEARNLGYDVYKEKDNEEFAKYLFENYGSEPWYCSKSNWK